MKKCICLWIVMTVVLAGCGGVEPERRAYPSVMGMDWKENQLCVIYGMPNLSKKTGQEKSEEGGVKNTISFRGNTMEDVLQIYQKTQERYLDLGHLQVVILGKGLLKEKEQYEAILQYLEQDPVIGDQAAVFQSRDMQEVMKLNDTESLGTYLTGMYENRRNNQRSEMVTLRELYRLWHEKEEVPLLPGVEVKEKFPEITA